MPSAPARTSRLPGPRAARFFDARADTCEDHVVRLVRGIRVDCEKPVDRGHRRHRDRRRPLAIAHLRRHADRQLRRRASIQATRERGSSPDCGLSWTLPQAIGHERAMRFLLEPRMHGCRLRRSPSAWWARSFPKKPSRTPSSPTAIRSQRSPPWHRETDQAPGDPSRAS